MFNSKQVKYLKSFVRITPLSKFVGWPGGVCGKKQEKLLPNCLSVYYQWMEWYDDQTADPDKLSTLDYGKTPEDRQYLPVSPVSPPS